MRLPIKRSIAT